MSRSSLVPTAYTEEIAEEILSGSNRFQEHISAMYLYNLICNTRIDSPFAYRICDAYESNSWMLDDDDKEERKFPIKKKLARFNRAYPEKKKPKAGDVDPQDWKILKDCAARNKGSQDDTPSHIELNMALLADTINLNKLEREVLTCLYVMENDYNLSTMMEHLVGKNPAKIVPVLARMLNRPKEMDSISKILDPSGTLFTAGIIISADSFEDPDLCIPTVDYQIQEIIGSAGANPEFIVEKLIGKPFTAQLDVADFPNHSEQIDHILKIIENAVTKGETGINILFYGPPGSGKTELAKAIAQKLDLSLYGVGEREAPEGSGDKKETSSFRISKLLQAHTFLKGSRKSILFFDEVEDLLLKGTDSSKKADTPNKIILNRLLEENPVVTIWAGNDLEKFHEAVRSRFTFELRVGYPPTLVRKKIWTRQAEMKGVKLPEEEILALARRFQAPPRMVANALKLASLNGSGREDIIKYMQSSSRLVFGSEDAIEPDTVLSEKFLPELISVDAESKPALERILAPDNFSPSSLFLQGEPGTGIISIAGYIAEKASTNLARHNMKDLLADSPMSSPADKIRNAFSEAADNKDLLLITHFDALSPNPRGASADWQLDGLASVFMECVYRYTVPLVVSTYNAEADIPETLRAGFVSNIKLNPLNAAQTKKASESYLARPLESLPDNLVPLDFSRAGKLIKKGAGSDEKTIRALLERQAAIRKNKMRMGFT